MTASTSRRWTLSILTAITIAGGLLRVYEINRNGFWLDEAFSVWMAEHPVPVLFEWLTHIDQHPPLYYTLLHFWLQAGDDAGYVRMLSALFSTLTIPVLFLIATCIAGLRAGFIAAVILALSPFQVRFAQEARMYALLMLNVSLATLALTYLLADQRAATVPIGRQLIGFVRAYRKQPRPHPLQLRDVATDLAWLAYMIFTAASVLTHNTAIFYPIAANLFVLGFIVYCKRTHRYVRPGDVTGSGAEASIQAATAQAFSPPALRNWLWAQAGAFLFWCPWALPAVVQSIGVYNQFWIPSPTIDTVISAVGALLNDFTPQFLGRTGIVWLGLVLLLVLGALYLRRQLSVLLFLLALLLTPLLGELLVSLRRPIFYDRTLIWTAIPLYLLVSFGLLQLRFKALIYAGLVMLCAVNLLSMQNYYQNFTKEQWREAAASVASEVHDGDLILFNATWVQIPFDYYFRHFDRTVDEHGVPVDLFDRGVLEPKMAESDLPRMESLVRDRQRVWLVYSHDWYTDPQRIIPAALEDEFDLVANETFTGLQILLYERR
jgi:mannosyltransferase